jgi:peptidoglycan/xylan/chitin deacetylase (PgdA/CDA1 family)
VLVGVLLAAFALGVVIGRQHPVPSGAEQAVAVQMTLPASHATKHRSSTTPVPILMYHVLANAPPGAPFPDLFVKPSDFAGQMQWLERGGYHAVTLDAVWRHWHGGRPLPRRPIVVSFDDGYRSDVGVGLPVLKEHGWPGVLNLKVRNLEPGDLRPRGVRRLIAAGWEIDAHTITHPDLTTVGDAQLEHEVAGSRKAIRRLFHVPADFFCYPAGRYDARVIAAVRSAGYRGATTTNFGLARPSQPYTLDRVRISGSDGMRGFVAKLTTLAG